MSARRDGMLNLMMGHFMTALYLCLPATCAVAVAYDFWHQGLSSPLSQIGLAILGLVASLRLIGYVLTAADAAMDAASRVMSMVSACTRPLVVKLAEAASSRGAPSMSQA